jgi:hypothetical protein
MTANRPDEGILNLGMNSISSQYFNWTSRGRNYKCLMGEKPWILESMAWDRAIILNASGLRQAIRTRDTASNWIKINPLWKTLAQSIRHGVSSDSELYTYGKRPWNGIPRLNLHSPANRNGIWVSDKMGFVYWMFSFSLLRSWGGVSSGGATLWLGWFSLIGVSPHTPVY